MIKALIFDYDGVIVDSLSLMYECYNSLSSELNLKGFSSIEEFRDFFSINWKDNFRRLGIKEENYDEALRLFDDYKEANQHKVKLVDGVVDIIDCLSRDYKIGIVTSARLNHIINGLKHTDLLGKMSSIIDCTKVINIKPSPESLIKCLDELACTRDEAAYIGDTTVDIEAARNANIKSAVAVAWGYDREEKLLRANPDLIIYHPIDLLNIEGLLENKSLTESRNPNSINIDKKNIEDVIKIINEEDKKVALAVEKKLPQITKAAQIIVDCFKNNGSLYIFGAGTSGRLGVLQQAECPPTFNTDQSMVRAFMAGGNEAVFVSKEGSEDDFDAGYHIARQYLKFSDAAIGVSASGRTPYVIGALKLANDIKCKSISVSCNNDSEVSKLADIPIELLVGPEVIAGSTRMKAGTATKMVLDMLTTGAMIKTGRVHNNLMINLQPKSEKLKERALRIVATMTGVPIENAKDALNQTGYNAREAIELINKGRI